VDAVVVGGTCDLLVVEGQCDVEDHAVGGAPPQGLLEAATLRVLHFQEVPVLAAGRQKGAVLGKLQTLDHVFVSVEGECVFVDVADDFDFAYFDSGYGQHVSVLVLAECDYTLQVLEGLVVVDYLEVGDLVDEGLSVAHDGDVLLLEPDALDLRTEGEFALERLALVVPHDDFVVGLARVRSNAHNTHQVRTEDQLHDAHAVLEVAFELL